MKSHSPLQALTANMAQSSSLNQFEFYFDVVCPFAYIASQFVEGIAKRTGNQLILKPVLLGGIFKANQVQIPENGSFVDTLSPSKRTYMGRDLFRFVEKRGVVLKFPANHPRRSLLAMRVLLYLSSTESSYTKKLDMLTVAKRFYNAYFVENLDISDASALAQVVASLGVSDAEKVVNEANSDVTIQESLQKRTDEAIKLHIFGVPSFYLVVNGERKKDSLIYGQDRLEVLERVLGGKTHLDILTHDVLARKTKILHKVEFVFDFSSPYAYAAFTRIQALFEPENLIFTPILLGALFKAVGMNDLPMTTMSDSKRKYYQSELYRQVREAGIRLNFPSRFPLRTILPLRTLIAAGPDTEKGRRLAAEIYHHLWVEDKDPQDTQMYIDACEKVGLNGKQILELANSSEVKNQLQKNTKYAAENGLFGVPSFGVKKSACTEWYWGDDRLLWALSDATTPSNASKL